MAARVKSDCFQNIQNAFCENTTLQPPVYGNSAKIGSELRNDFLIKKVVLFLAAVGSIFKKRTKVCCI